MAKDVREAPSEDAVPEHRGHDVFVSYSRADRDAVVLITESLTARGKRAWVDLEDIPPSAEWMAEIRSAIDAATGFLIVISPELARSKVCAEELGHARLAGKRIVPLLIRPTPFQDVPQPLAPLNWIDATGGISGEVLDRVVQALDTDLDHVKAHTRLLVRAMEWERSSDDSSALLRGRELAEAETIVADAETEPRPTELQTRFVLASRRAVGRRQRGAIGVVSVLLAIALVLGVFALTQRNAALDNERTAERRAAQSRSRELAVSALGQLDVDPERSLLLALAAMDQVPTAEATSTLRSAISASHVRETFRGHSGPVLAVAYDDAGQHLVSVGGDGTARIWSVTGAAEHVLLDGHEDIIDAVAFSPDGAIVATASYDGTARLSDAASGENLAILKGHDGAVFDVGFSPDGSRVVTTGQDGTGRIWSVPDGVSLVTLSGHDGPIYDVAFGPGGSTMATASDDDTARLWDAATGRQLHVLRGHDDGLYTIAFAPDGRSVVTASEDGTAAIWNVSTGRMKTRLRGHRGPVIAASFDTTGTRVVTASEDSTARVWDTATGRSLVVLRGHQDELDSAKFSPDGSRILTTSDDGTARVWDAETGDTLSVLRGHDGIVEDGVYSPDGQHVATAGEDGTVRVWQDVTGQVIATGGGFSVAAAPDGDRVALTDGAGRLRVIDPATNGTLWATRVDTGLTAPVFNVDGSMLAAAGFDGVGHVWNAQTGDPVATLRGHDPGYTNVDTLDRTGEVLTVGEDGTARLWDARSGRALQVIHREGLWEAHLFLDGTKIFTTGLLDGRIEMWDAHTGDELWHRTGLVSSGGIGAAVSPDGTLAFTTTTSKAQVWNAETGDLVTTLDDGGTVRGAGFTTDSARIVARCEDGVARIFDARTGRVLVAMPGTPGGVNGIYDSPDGKWVVTTSNDDGRARVFDAHTAALVATFPSGVGAGGFPVMADHDQVVVTPTDGAVRIDRCDACAGTADLVTLARSRVTRDLTAAERHEFFGGTRSPSAAPTTPPNALSNDSGPVPDGPLEPGLYDASAIVPGLSFAIDDGWLATGFLGAEPGQTREGSLIQLQRLDVFSNGLSFATLDPGRVTDDAKRWNERFNVLPFPRNLTAWFEAQPHIAVTHTARVDVGEVDGQLVETVVKSAPANSWPNCGGGCVTLTAFTLHRLTGPITTDDEIGAAAPGEVDRWIVLRLHDRSVLINAFSASRTDFGRFWPVAREVIRSIEFATA